MGNLVAEPKAPAVSPAENYYQQARKHYRAKQFGAARKALQSARQTLSQTPNPTLQARLCMLESGILIQEGAYAEALRVLEPYLQAPDSLSRISQQLLARIFNQRGLAYELSNQLDSALQSYRQGVQYARLSHDSTSLAAILVNLGLTNRRLDDWPQARDAYLEALSIRQQLADTVGQLRVLNNLAVLAAKNGAAQQAGDFFGQAARLAAQLPDSLEWARALNNLGNLYLRNGRVDSAYTCFQQARDIVKPQQAPKLESAILYNLGQSLLDQQQAKQAEQHLLACYKLRLKHGDTEQQLSTLVALARALLGANKYGEADSLLNRVLAQATRLKLPQLQQASLQYLAELAANQQEFEQAYRYSQQLNALFQTAETTGSLLQSEPESPKADQAGNQFPFNLSSNLSGLFLPGANPFPLIVLLSGLALLVGFIWVRPYLPPRKLADRRIILASSPLQEQPQPAPEQAEDLAAPKAQHAQQAEESPAEALEDTQATPNNQLASLMTREDFLLPLVVHELKSPLVQLESLLHMMEMDDSNHALSANQQNYLKLANQVVQSSNLLISSLLESGRIFTNQLAPERRPLDLAWKVEQLRDTFVPMAQYYGIGLELVQPHARLEIHTDERLLDRVLQNLLTNAIKYTRQETTIRIWLDSTTAWATVAIQDQGPGIAEEQLENMFARYEVGSAKPPSGAQATGLGLYIVQEFSRLLEGHVRVTSEVGHGSTFYLDLPR